MSKIVVAIPCLNEEATIRQVVAAFRNAVPEAEMIVFDNGSDDRSIACALLGGANVVRVPLRGKGAVVQDIFKTCDADVILMVDGDATYPADQARDLVNAVLDDGFDMAVGTRLQDFTTGSHSLATQARLVSLNVNVFDALKWRGVELRADARLGLEALSQAMPGWQSAGDWQAKATKVAKDWRTVVDSITGRREALLPYEGEVIGAVQRSAAPAANSPSNDIVVCAAGTLPAELHKLWRTAMPGGYHMEYGYSCMGYEIAGGLGVKMAKPEREVIVMVGDGSYLMLNSEIATSVMLGKKLIIVVLDNLGYGCINRLQQASGGEPFNNLFDDCVQGPGGAPRIDFAAHATSLGALAENVKTIPQFEAAMSRARAADRTYLICIETDPDRTTAEGGCWWEVAVPEVSDRVEVRKARHAYEQDKQQQKL